LVERTFLASFIRWKAFLQEHYRSKFEEKYGVLEGQSEGLEVKKPHPLNP
jgi:hypothetical protein